MIQLLSSQLTPEEREGENQFIFKYALLARILWETLYNVFFPWELSSCLKSTSEINKSRRVPGNVEKKQEALKNRKNLFWKSEML